MKLPSLRRLAQETFETFNRFPFAILSAIVGTGAALIIVQHDFSSGHLYQALYNISLVGFLGISLYTMIQLAVEKMNWKFSSGLGIKLSVLGLLFIYYSVLPANIFETYFIHLIRFMFFAAAAHLLVSIGPFIESGNIISFWEFNKTLFLRFLTAAFYTLVLFIGLTIALSAVQHLFNIDIQPRRYVQLWWFLAGVFNTWFFLSGVPKEIASFDADLQYPKGLKIFTQYVLIPLVVVYVLILYAYMVKIIVDWDWPKGWVGYLVLGFSTTGIFSLLLIHPIKDRPENKWMETLWRLFFFILIPLVVLLLLAIWRRTSEYGLTERRYIVVVLGLWLAAISLYYIFSRTKSIKVIPLSLCVLSLAVSFGPWGAFSMSERHQIKRLEAVLVKNNILVNGKIEKAKQGVSFEDAKRVSSIISYLSEVHGFNGIQSWFKGNLDTVVNNRRESRWSRRQENSKSIIQILGVQYVSEWEMRLNALRRKEYRFQAGSSCAVETAQYKYLINNISLACSDAAKAIHLDKEQWNITLLSDSSSFVFVPLHDVHDRFSIDLRDFTSRLYRQQNIQEYVDNRVPQDSMVLTKTHKNVRVMLFFNNYCFASDSLGTRPISATVSILINPQRE